MVSVAGFTVNKNAFVADNAGAVESSTWTVKLNEPAEGGTPVRAPVAEQSSRKFHSPIGVRSR